MTFDSSNREELETRTTNESLVEQIRIAMSEGCIRSSRVFDMVDEALDRLKKMEEVSVKAHDLARQCINYSSDFKPYELRGVADDLWDVIHKGDEEWNKVHSF